MAARSYTIVLAFVLVPLLTSPTGTLALDLNTSSPTSISQTASSIASGLFNRYYNASSTAGHFNQPKPWYWWLSGNGWNGVMDYTIYTGDTTYKSDLLSALSDVTFNLGSNYSFSPAAQQGWEANDDQMYWVYNALTAMEYNFTAITPAPWLDIAVNAFNEYLARWKLDSATCGGGLKWQYTPTANGYYYKNSVTNGGFFQTAARLARYTGNSTYADWATTIWDWSVAVGLVGPAYNVHDGASDSGTNNCTNGDDTQWSYNVATYLHGAANMYSYTGASNASKEQTLWEGRVQGLLDAANKTFFSPPTANATGVMYEQECEMTFACTTDQTSFKSSLARWLGKTSVLVPSVKESITGLLEGSAKAAAASCTQASSGNTTVCGMQWWTADGYDGYSDFGTQLSALEVVQSLLVTVAPELVTQSSS